MSLTEPWRHEEAFINGLRLHFVTAGTGPLVILLHGFPQFWYAWRRQIPALAGGFRVVVPDLRGCGETKAHIVGHDWGGAIAWALAMERPEIVDRLVVVNCPHPSKFIAALGSDWRQILRSWYVFFFQLPKIPEWALLRKDCSFGAKMTRRRERN